MTRRLSLFIKKPQENKGAHEIFYIFLWFLIL